MTRTTSPPEVFDTGTLPPYIKPTQAAELLEVSVDTIRRLEARGEIRGRLFGARTLRIETASLFSNAARSTRSAA